MADEQREDELPPEPTCTCWGDREYWGHEPECPVPAWREARDARSSDSNVGRALVSLSWGSAVERIDHAVELLLDGKDVEIETHDEQTRADLIEVLVTCLAAKGHDKISFNDRLVATEVAGHRRSIAVLVVDDPQPPRGTDLGLPRWASWTTNDERHVVGYADLPDGETDPRLALFELRSRNDAMFVVDLLKRVGAQPMPVAVEKLRELRIASEAVAETEGEDR